MPHIVLEHSANIKPQLSTADLFSQIHQQVHSITGVLLLNCKSRRYVAEEFLIGEGAEADVFIHLSVRMIEGRSSEIKQKLGSGLVSVLRDGFAVSDEDMHLSLIHISEPTRPY